LNSPENDGTSSIALLEGDDHRRAGLELGGRSDCGGKGNQRPAICAHCGHAHSHPPRAQRVIAVRDYSSVDTEKRHKLLPSLLLRARYIALTYWKVYSIVARKSIRDWLGV
jgi:hypothetical protein